MGRHAEPLSSVSNTCGAFPQVDRHGSATRDSHGRVQNSSGRDPHYGVYDLRSIQYRMRFTADSLARQD